MGPRNWHFQAYQIILKLGGRYPILIPKLWSLDLAGLRTTRGAYYKPRILTPSLQILLYCTWPGPSMLWVHIVLSDSYAGSLTQKVV